MTGRPAASAPAVAVRDSTAADLPEIQAIYAHHVEIGLGSFEEVAPDVAAMMRRREDLLRRGLPYLVAAGADAVLGYAYAGPYRTRSAYRYTVEDSVYVGPWAQGRRIGRLLLAELIARCSSLGYRQMVAVIGDSANLSSIRLHARQGFAEVGRLPAVGFKFGRWVDSIVMQRALGEGAATLPPGRP
ncbi:MAG: GNAT family N-acetyltransferase [Pseudomonadota bacterium]